MSHLDPQKGHVQHPPLRWFPINSDPGSKAYRRCSLQNWDSALKKRTPNSLQKSAQSSKKGPPSLQESAQSSAMLSRFPPKSQLPRPWEFAAQRKSTGNGGSRTVPSENPAPVLRFSPDNRNETKKNTCFSPWFLIRLPKKKSAEKNAMSSFLWFQCGARGAASATTVRISRLTPFGRATSCWASWECGECEASLASYRKPGKKTKNGALVRVGTKRTTHVLSGINPFNDLRRLV